MEKKVKLADGPMKKLSFMRKFYETLTMGLLKVQKALEQLALKKSSNSEVFRHTHIRQDKTDVTMVSFFPSRISQFLAFSKHFSYSSSKSLHFRLRSNFSKTYIFHPQARNQSILRAAEVLSKKGDNSFLKGVTHLPLGHFQGTNALKSGHKFQISDLGQGRPPPPSLPLVAPLILLILKAHLINFYFNLFYLFIKF